jgi:hypothetical protein
MAARGLPGPWGTLRRALTTLDFLSVVRPYLKGTHVPPPGDCLRDLLGNGRLFGAVGPQGGALVIRGEAGVGKTALLDHASASSDFRVLRGTGVQAESELPYAAAHQLLCPLLPLLDALPVPQAQAVRVALGMADGGAPDRFPVALGFLSLLSEAGRNQPVLCALDDVQWCDGASVDALLFVARRVTTDPVAFLFSVRDESASEAFEPARVPELRVGGLSEEAAGELLTAATGARLPHRVRSVLVRRTRGNPLALMELARALSGAQLLGREPLPDPLPVGDRLERAFLVRRTGHRCRPAQV